MKSMTTSKRILTLILCAMMFAALLPGAASADDAVYLDPSAHIKNTTYNAMRSISVSSVSTLEAALKQAAQQASSDNMFYILTTKSITLNKSLTIPEYTELDVADSTTLTIARGATLTNNWILYVEESNAKLSIRGTLMNNSAVFCGFKGGKIALDGGSYQEGKAAAIIVRLPQNSSGNPDSYLPGFNLNDFYRADGSDGWYEYGRKSQPVLNGWYKILGNWYYYKNGEMVTNDWAKDSKGWCYLGSDGTMVKSAWKKDSKGWCYLKADGRMAVSQWVKDNGKWYYMNSSGHMVTGWQKVGGIWYFFKDSGVMASDTWAKDSKGWCYLGSDGKMVTNAWKKDSKGWCYLKADGRMAIGQWVKDGGKWYYLDGSGYMKTGWLKLSGKWYYLESSGVMVTGTRTINGKSYTFNSSGVCQNP